MLLLTIEMKDNCLVSQVEASYESSFAQGSHRHILTFIIITLLTQTT
jgi:hypothetical protein